MFGRAAYPTPENATPHPPPPPLPLNADEDTLPHLPPYGPEWRACSASLSCARPPPGLLYSGLHLHPPAQWAAAGLNDNSL